jgi:hypothetical protein
MKRLILAAAAALLSVQPTSAQPGTFPVQFGGESWTCWVAFTPHAGEITIAVIRPAEGGQTDWFDCSAP